MQVNPLSFIDQRPHTLTVLNIIRKITPSNICFDTWQEHIQAWHIHCTAKWEKTSNSLEIVTVKRLNMYVHFNNIPRKQQILPQEKMFCYISCRSRPEKNTIVLQITQVNRYGGDYIPIIWVIVTPVQKFNKTL